MAGYPLERLRELRARRATGATLDLAAALAGLAAAEEAVAAAAAVVETARGAARAVILAGDGATPAWAVARRAAYATRLRRDLARAEAALRARCDEQAEWGALVDETRDRVRTARAEHEVIDRHRSRWHEEVRRGRERRDE